MSQSDSLLVKLRKHYFTSVVAGAAGGFTYAMLSSRSPETTIMGAIIGGLSYSTAELVSLLGNTWWLRGLLWGTTMGIVVSALIRLLLPSVDFDVISGIASFIPGGLVYYFLEKKLSRNKKR